MPEAPVLERIGPPPAHRRTWSRRTVPIRSAHGADFRHMTKLADWFMGAAPPSTPGRGRGGNPPQTPRCLRRAGDPVLADVAPFMAMLRGGFPVTRYRNSGWRRHRGVPPCSGASRPSRFAVLRSLDPSSARRRPPERRDGRRPELSTSRLRRGSNRRRHEGSQKAVRAVVSGAVAVGLPDAPCLLRSSSEAAAGALGVWGGFPPRPRPAPLGARPEPT